MKSAIPLISHQIKEQPVVFSMQMESAQRISSPLLFRMCLTSDLQVFIRLYSRVIFGYLRTFIQLSWHKNSDYQMVNL